jgi:2-polyprenyl-6-hydroxyphenyl methylase/3-demethylubiquinone-9 3-methyltransferase
MFPVTSPSGANCKICGGPSPLFGVVDFHKSCIEANHKKLALSGIPIYYRRCQQCGFLFTTAFDDWSHAAFARHIYNADYKIVDPDYDRARPEGNARLIGGWFANARSALRILDYGGGNGRFAELLRQAGFAATSYDSFVDGPALPSARFNVITSFEVLEHSSTPRETAAEIASLLADDGIVVCSTLLQTQEFETLGLNWWYVGPRNGHVSIHSRASLSRLFAQLGFRLATFSNNNLHIAFKTLPPFAAHLLGTAGAAGQTE